MSAVKVSLAGGSKPSHPNNLHPPGSAVDSDIELGKKYAHRFLHRLKQHHTQNVWVGMVTAKRIALQARFATVVALVGLAIAIVASTAQATSSHSGFMRPNAVLNFYNLLLIWSATLSQKNPWQLKLGCFLPVCVWCTNEIVAATNGGYPNRSIAKWCTQFFIIVVLPILLYQIFKVVAATVRNHRNVDDLLEITSTMSAKVLHSLPVLFYVLLGLLQSILGRNRGDALICGFFVNATWNPKEQLIWKIVPTGGWENCDPANLHVPTYPITVQENALRALLLQKTDNDSFFFTKLLTGYEISLLFFTKFIMTQVRHKTMSDIFAMKVSGLELALMIVTVMRLSIDLYIGTISARKQCLTINELTFRRTVGMGCFMLLLAVGLCISIYLIVLSRRAQHKIKNEIDEIHRSRSGYDGGMTIQRHKSAELQKRNTADQALWNGW